MKVLTHFLLWSIGLAKAQTFYTPAECECLERHATAKKRLVEIGCWHGVNTSRLRRVMGTDGILFGTDPYQSGRLGFNMQRIIANNQVNKVQNGSVRWLRLTDIQAAQAMRASGEPPVDFVFSDSINTYEGFRNTWESWSPLVAPYGIYILANSCPSANRHIEDAGSTAFTRQVILHDPSYELLEVVGTFTVMRRRSIT